VTLGSWTALLRAPHLAPLAMLSLGIGLYSFNTFLVATALPRAVVEVGGAAHLAWATTMFLVSAIVAGAAGAVVKARLGARGGLLLGGGLFLAGTACCGLAPSWPVLLLGRALQGGGEGMVAAISYALIPVLFPAALVAKVFAVEALVWALAGFAGPVVGGVLTEAVSWRAAFLVNAPMGLAFIALVLVVVRAGREGVVTPAPLLRLGALAGGILLVASSSLAGGPGLAGLAILGGCALLAATAVVDGRSTARLFPQGAFRPATALGAGLALVLLMPVAHSFTVIHLTLSLQQGWGFAPTLAGAFFAAGPLAWSGSMLVVANLRGAWVPAFGIRFGPVLLLVAVAGQVAAVLAGLPWAMLPFLVAGGAAFGVGWAFLSMAVMQAAAPGERDRAAGLVPTVQSAGYAIGAALTGLAASVFGLDGASPGGTVAAFAPVVACGAVPAALAVALGLGRRDWKVAGGTVSARHD
jgi:MFS family permease